MNVNKTQLARLRSVKQQLQVNLIDMKILIEWCEDYKDGKTTIAKINLIFTLKYSDVMFVIYNLEEIKEMESE